VSAFSSTAKADFAPIEEVDQYSAIINKKDPYYYENLLNDQQHEADRHAYLLESPTRRRSINAPMISGTTESFAKAFSHVLTASDVAHGAKQGHIAQTSMTNGIGRYKAISRVINYEITPLGESLNFSI
jgi:hypothetical protein